MSKAPKKRSGSKKRGGDGKPKANYEYLKTKKGKKREVRAGYYIRQPHRASANEITHVAEMACEGEAKKLIDGMNENPYAPEIKFHSIKFLRIIDAKSRTHLDSLTGRQHWQGTGTGVCNVFVYVESD